MTETTGAAAESQPEPYPEPYPEPWMRGTHTELDPVRRAVVHALELAEEDARRWAVGLSEEALFRRFEGLPSVAFHLRHIVRSLDRLLTYAEGGGLRETQIAELATEHAFSSASAVIEEFVDGMKRAKERVASTQPECFAEARGIGRKRLPTTMVGLLIHCADHTQRHAGQMVTTAKLAVARSGNGTV